VSEPAGTLTVARFLSIFYRYAARFELWRSGKPLGAAEHLALQEEEAARDVSL
jgi:hypothetical protein